ncbi:PREDICTED: transcriptional activator Myb-like [Camelina sativa]|uniref:Transcriptional activator Myb-like n=1 Tax=Camelina sativa TaxID=90675 RepID=A0ABM0USP5_CAMSA|nr:PREDICTED: transcriptional activator Myb-like [Camelina sativa]
MRQERKKKTKRPSRGERLWTESQDLKLIELVEAYGLESWNLIAEKMQTRSAQGCRMRWVHELDPKLNKTEFTKAEEELMITAQKLYGNKWSKIAKLLNRRTDYAVRMHFNRNVWRQTEPNITFSPAPLNPYAYTVPGNGSYEGIGIKNYSCNTPNEEATNLYARMPVQLSGHQHHFPTFPAGSSSALFTPHVSISQPSSSPEAEDTMMRKPPKFIDFLGVGDS